jgi:hypothetical protein
VVRVPSLTRRSGSAAVRDENNDGRIDELDERAEVQDREAAADRTVRLDREDAIDREEAIDRESALERDRAEILDREAALDRDRHDHDGDRFDRAQGRAAVVDGDVDHRAHATEVVAPAVRPRASGLATFGLILGVLAAAAVATGVLAAPGVALGVLGTLVAVGGAATTSRRHVTGRFDAMLGVMLSLGAVVVGLLALGNAIPWPDTDTNQVSRLVDWLNAQFPWLDRF